jgi:CDP-glycerol glycerophosphotransferase
MVIGYMLNKLRKTFNKSKGKQKEKLKQSIEIAQEKQKLYMKGQFSKSYYNIEELWLSSRSTDEWIRVKENSLEGHKFDFEVSLENLMTTLISKFTGDHSFDWYIQISVPTSEVGSAAYERLEKKATFFEKNQITYARYYIRLGRFQHTKTDALPYYYHNNNSGICYITTKGNLSFLLNAEPDSPTKIQIDTISAEDGSIKLNGKLFTRNSKIENGSLVLKGRNNNEEVEGPVSFTWKEETNQKFGLNRYEYGVNIEFLKICNGKLLKEDVYDLYLKLKLHDMEEEKLVRIGRPTFRARNFVRDTYYEVGNMVSVINPYYTFKASNLSFEVFEYEKDTYQYLETKLKFAFFHRLLNKKKDIWIIGERPYKAQDTGYHFFKYMRENHPNRNVYYVIEKDSPEKKNVEPLGNVLDFKSKEHIWYSLIASRVISSHHPDYLYPLRTSRFKKSVKATKVFLQHGVMGTKNMIANYGKQAESFDTDLFLVSSDFEKEMIVNDFGYSPKEVGVTGLSRFDQLFANDIPVKNQLLIIPTWRDWIGSDDAFLESEYFQQYKDLIRHPALHTIAKESNMEIVFCLHPNMQKFTPYFSHPSVRVISQGEVDVQRLLKESKIMITDYSSVGFDFSFLYKPIIYFQFDRSRFIGKRPSHLDLDNDLPGGIVKNIDELLTQLKVYEKNGFTMLEENKVRADKFLKYRDRQSSKRIFDVIENFQVEKSFIEKQVEKPLVKAVLNRFRKSKWYFPTMKVFYRMIKTLLPVDKKLILFESGVGKQYADSPRYIYEEIVKRNLNYKKIWVYNKSIRFNDLNTQRIKRLSPQYYYYLARAGYWVNNQNFPTYIEKRKGTTYIQTWHGTPLKKMLFDIENIQGRSDNYLERVHQATKQWDYLVSPSEYATKAFKSAFRYKGDILEVGYPRNDLFYKQGQEDVAKKVKKRLNIPEEKKIILYAPTFRDNETKGKNKFVFNVKMDLHEMQQQLGEDYIILMRMHVVISSKFKIPEELESFVYNVSNYPEIQELYLISDMLMTDYSSVMFDFANTGRPILYYTYDLEEYKNDIRGFYMDFEQEAPGPFLFNTDDIIHAVKNIDEVKRNYQVKYDSFKEKYCSLEDGNAANRIVDRFFQN